MEIICKILSLAAILLLYGIILIGIKKYNMRDILNSWTKKEKLGVLVGILMLCLGMVIKISYCPLMVGNGIVSKSIYMVTDVLFDNNETIISLIVIVAFYFPAIIFQVFFAQKITEKFKIPYCNPFFYIMLLTFQIGVYSCWLTQTPEEAIIILIVSALLYFGICIFEGIIGKKSLLYILVYIVLWIVMVILEENKIWDIYIVSILFLIESICLAWFRGKTIIFRKTLRTLGTLMLFGIIVICNIEIWQWF